MDHMVFRVPHNQQPSSKSKVISYLLGLSIHLDVLSLLYDIGSCLNHKPNLWPLFQMQDGPPRTGCIPVPLIPRNL